MFYKENSRSLHEPQNNMNEYALLTIRKLSTMLITTVNTIVKAQQ